MSNGRKAEILRTISWPELVHRYRHSYRDSQSAVMNDAITMVAVALLAAMVLMFLAATDRDGLSAFVGGIIVGAIGGAVFWSYYYHHRRRTGTDASHDA